MPHVFEICSLLHEQSLIQLGSVFPRTSSVYFRHWCVMCECDGPSLIFVRTFWFGFRFGRSCYSAQWCWFFWIFVKALNYRKQTRVPFMEDQQSSWAVFSPMPYCRCILRFERVCLFWVLALLLTCLCAIHLSGGRYKCVIRCHKNSSGSAAVSWI